MPLDKSLQRILIAWVYQVPGSQQCCSPSGAVCSWQGEFKRKMWSRSGDRFQQLMTINVIFPHQLGPKFDTSDVCEIKMSPFDVRKWYQVHLLLELIGNTMEHLLIQRWFSNASKFATSNDAGSASQWRLQSSPASQQPGTAELFSELGQPATSNLQQIINLQPSINNQWQPTINHQPPTTSNNQQPNINNQ